MKTQIKNYGNSNVIVLTPEWMKYMKAKVGDWADLSDVTIEKK